MLKQSSVTNVHDYEFIKMLAIPHLIMIENFI